MTATMTQGALANQSGRHHEQSIRALLRAKGYTPVKARSLGELRGQRKGLYTEAGCFAEQCEVPLIAPYHQGRDRRVTVDFAVWTPGEQAVLLSVKSQESAGSADEKLEYEVSKLIATELPAALFVHGDGFRQAVLEEVWERGRHHGNSRVLLFRTYPKLLHWIEDGMPVAGRGTTNSEIFMRYADLAP